MQIPYGYFFWNACFFYYSLRSLISKFLLLLFSDLDRFILWLVLLTVWFLNVSSLDSVWYLLLLLPSPCCVILWISLRYFCFSTANHMWIYETLQELYCTLLSVDCRIPKLGCLDCLLEILFMKNKNLENQDIYDTFDIYHFSL